MFRFYPTYTSLTFSILCSFHRANRQGALNDTKNANGNVTGTLDLSWYLGIYTGLTAVTVLFGIARSLLVFYVLVNASQTLHNRMFESILKAPVLFFDRNPIGK